MAVEPILDQCLEEYIELQWPSAVGRQICIASICNENLFELIPRNTRLIYNYCKDWLGKQKDSPRPHFSVVIIIAIIYYSTSISDCTQFSDVQ